MAIYRIRRFLFDELLGKRIDAFARYLAMTLGRYFYDLLLLSELQAALERLQSSYEADSIFSICTHFYKAVYLALSR